MARGNPLTVAHGVVTCSALKWENWRYTIGESGGSLGLSATQPGAAISRPSDPDRSPITVEIDQQAEHMIKQNHGSLTLGGEQSWRFVLTG
jgi:hypothetical protein